MRNLMWKAAVLTGATATALAWTGVAHAEPSVMATRYVDGFEQLTDDFGDHEVEIGLLCDDFEQCPNSNDTDTVLLWQSILAAEGYLGVDAESLSGIFDSQTSSATQQYQDAHGLKSDGIVGDLTWETADDKLAVSGANVRYVADGGGHVQFVRGDTDGVYRFGHVETPGGDVRENTSGATRIEHFYRSIGLE